MRPVLAARNGSGLNNLPDGFEINETLNGSIPLTIVPRTGAGGPSTLREVRTGCGNNFEVGR